MSMVLYQDKDVIVTQKQVTIKCYYFPFGCSKTISFEDIKYVQMKSFASRGKIWGMNASEWGYWMPGDCSRWDYDKFIAVQTGSSVTPCFTCKDMDKAFELLQQRLQLIRREPSNIQRTQRNNQPLIIK